MSVQTLEVLTQQYIESQRTPVITFAWQGGEPTLLGIDFYRNALAFQEKYRRPGTQIVNAFQTNGINVDREWARFFKENNFLVGISLDGPREMHDACRVDKGGQPTFDRVISGLRWLQEYQVEYNILTCLHSKNVEYPQEVYLFLRDTIGARYLQFIPIVEIGSSSAGRSKLNVSERTISGDQYGNFLKSVFYEWVHRDVGEVFVQLFDVSLSAWMGYPPGLCIFAETCGEAVAVEHTGDVYSCDHFVNPDHYLGNPNETPLAQLVLGKDQNRFGKLKKSSLPNACKTCSVRFICNGACPKDRLARSPDGSGALNWLCSGYKSFFQYIDPVMKWMSLSIRAGRPAADIMSLLETGKLLLPKPVTTPSKTRKRRR